MRYTRTARWLHWLTVLIILMQVAAGLWIVWGPEMAEPAKLRLYTFHESLGLTVLPLTLFRLWWRWTHWPPPLPVGLSPVVVAAARLNHAAFYVLLIAMPVTGFLATNAWGFPVRWFWLVPIPSPIGREEAWAPILSALHDWMSYVLIALIALHVAGALWHHLIRRDETLRRMLL